MLPDTFTSSVWKGFVNLTLLLSRAARPLAFASGTSLYLAVGEFLVFRILIFVGIALKLLTMLGVRGIGRVEFGGGNCATAWAAKVGRIVLGRCLGSRRYSTTRASKILKVGFGWCLERYVASTRASRCHLKRPNRSLESCWEWDWRLWRRKVRTEDKEGEEWRRGRRASVRREWEAEVQ